MSSSLKKSLKRVKSSLNKKLASLDSNNDTNGAHTQQQDSTILSLSQQQDDQDRLRSVTSSNTLANNGNISASSSGTMDQEDDYFGMKYEDIGKDQQQQQQSGTIAAAATRKRNFSQAHSHSSISSSSANTRKSSLESHQIVSNEDHIQNRSRASSGSSSLRQLHENTETTILQSEGEIIPSRTSSASSINDQQQQQLSQQQQQQVQHDNDNLQTTTNMITTTITSAVIDSSLPQKELLPPIPTVDCAPCTTEQLSPVFPASISPLSDNFNSSNSIPLLHDLQQQRMSLPLSKSSTSIGSGSNRPRAGSSNLRSSLQSQVSLPALSNSSTAITPIAENIMIPGIGHGHGHGHGNGENDFADAMAISILEKVPHDDDDQTKEISVDNWCI